MRFETALNIALTISSLYVLLFHILPTYKDRKRHVVATLKDIEVNDIFYFEGNPANICICIGAGRYKYYDDGMEFEVKPWAKDIEIVILSEG